MLADNAALSDAIEKQLVIQQELIEDKVSLTRSVEVLKDRLCDECRRLHNDAKDSKPVQHRHSFDASQVADLKARAKERYLREEAERMADAFLKNQKAVSLRANCEFEVPTIGEVMGYPFRGKADVLGKNKIVDIKTTSDIKSFPYSAKKYGYDVQAFIYCELFDIAPENFTFLVIDKGSLDIGVFNISMEFYLEGGRKTELGIERYKAFFEEGGDLDQYYIEDTL